MCRTHAPPITHCWLARGCTQVPFRLQATFQCIDLSLAITLFCVLAAHRPHLAMDCIKWVRNGPVGVGSVLCAARWLAE